MKLMHFTAEWCGPCKMMKPIIDEVVADKDLEYIAVDIDENRETAIDYEILGVPTFILMDDNNEALVRITGAFPKQKFIDALGI